MKRLIATIGLQASGKTTWAREWVAEDPVNRVRVERDVLREMLGFGFVKENEKFVLDLRNNLIENALKCGKSVVVSDTNFPWRTLRELRSLARRNGAEFEVQDFTHVSVDICIGRDEVRGLHDPFSAVGAKVITDFYNRYLKGKPYPYPLPPEEAERVWEPYIEDPALPVAVVVDIDGTLTSDMNGRSPYDWHKVDGDTPRFSVVDLLGFLSQDEELEVILMSGRDSAARQGTEKWLAENDVWYDQLHMRAEGDNRRDDLVKYELFNEHVRDRYRVWFVLDDRDQVVKMWREIGLDCFQVNYGNF